METEAVQLCAQLLDHDRPATYTLRRNPQPGDPRSGLLTQDAAALDRRGREVRQEALLDIIRARLELALLPQELGNYEQSLLHFRRAAELQPAGAATSSALEFVEGELARQQGGQGR